MNKHGAQKYVAGPIENVSRNTKIRRLNPRNFSIFKVGDNANANSEKRKSRRNESLWQKTLRESLVVSTGYENAEYKSHNNVGFKDYSLDYNKKYPNGWAKLASGLVAGPRAFKKNTSNYEAQEFDINESTDYHLDDAMAKNIKRQHWKL